MTEIPTNRLMCHKPEAAVISGKILTIFKSCSVQGYEDEKEAADLEMQDKHVWSRKCKMLNTFQQSHCSIESGVSKMNLHISKVYRIFFQSCFATFSMSPVKKHSSRVKFLLQR